MLILIHLAKPVQFQPKGKASLSSTDMLALQDLTQIHSVRLNSNSAVTAVFETGPRSKLGILKLRLHWMSMNGKECML